MEHIPTEWVQLHTLITKDNETLLSKVQGKILMEKGKRVSKSILINEALTDYLNYKISEEK